MRAEWSGRCCKRAVPVVPVVPAGQEASANSAEREVRAGEG
jgi:hypothetical protein